MIIGKATSYTLQGFPSSEVSKFMRYSTVSQSWSVEFSIHGRYKQFIKAELYNKANI